MLRSCRTRSFSDAGRSGPSHHGRLAGPKASPAGGKRLCVDSTARRRLRACVRCLTSRRRWPPSARNSRTSTGGTHTLGNMPTASRRARVSASRGSVLTRDLAISATCIGFATVTEATSGTSMSYRCHALLVASSVTTSVRRRCLRTHSSKSLKSIRRAVSTTCCLLSTAATVAYRRCTSKPTKRVDPSTIPFCSTINPPPPTGQHWVWGAVEGHRVPHTDSSRPGFPAGLSVELMRAVDQTEPRAHRSQTGGRSAPAPAPSKRSADSTLRRVAAPCRHILNRTRRAQLTHRAPQNRSVARRVGWLHPGLRHSWWWELEPWLLVQRFPVAAPLRFL